MKENAKTILLVEDEVLIAMAEARTLEKHGYSVIMTHSGEDAVDSMKKNPDLDLILMDIDLGRGIDGTQAAEMILKERDVPVVFLSSHTEPEVVKKTEKITSYGYVVKNAGNTVLMASIRMAFKLHEAHIRISEQKQELQAANEELESSNEEFEVINEELIHSQEELSFREEVLRIQYDLSVALNSISDLNLALERVLETVFVFESIDSGGIYSADPDTGALELKAYRGLSPEFVALVRHYDADSPNVRLALAGEARYIHYDEIRPFADVVRLKEGLQALAFIPVFHHGKLIATLNLASHSHKMIPESIRSVLETLALQIGSALARIRSVEQQMESDRRYRFLLESIPVGIFRNTPGHEGKFIMLNSALARMHGYDSIEELHALKVVDLYADREERSALSDELTRLGNVQGREIRLKRKDGSTFYGSVTARTVFDKKDNTVYLDGSVVDITDRKKAEEELVLALEEKQALLSEIQHRVKNSLTMIASLTTLEEERSESQETKTAMGTLRGRILSLSNLYAMMFASGEMREVRLDRYLEEIARSLLRANSGGVNIEFQPHLEGVLIDARRASPLGLIVNELITNALKYAFNGRNAGKLRLSLKNTAGVLELEVADDGGGLPEGFDMDRSAGLGMLLVTLLSRQLGGCLEHRREGNETVFRVTAMEDQ